MQSSDIFEQCKIGGIEVKNRIFRSATYEGTAIDGCADDRMLNMYRELSEGGAGLLITGWICVSRSDHPRPGTITLWDDTTIPSLQKLTEMAHGNDTRVVAQLNHSGTFLYHDPGAPIFAPSAVPDPLNGIVPQPFSEAQVAKLVDEFGDAALRAKQAGFDGVQIHCAHGYLFSKWLSPAFNQRTDSYGGNTAGRVRVVLDVLRNIKRKCGDEYPVWIKMNSDDFSPEGVTEELFLASAKLLADSGIDAIEVSGGTRSGKHLPSRPKRHSAYHRKAAERLASSVGTSVILVGGLRNIDEIESILGETDLEAISLCRPLLREPALIKRWADGDRADATCIACNGCFNPKGTQCIFLLSEEERAEQKEFLKQMLGKK